jgi:predicted acylesterase/phospholipase RssA
VTFRELRKIPGELKPGPHADNPSEGKLRGQVVLVFHGSGALGSYLAGVYQALHEASIEPKWIIGTSIGVINTSLIEGKRRDDRIPKLKDHALRECSI